MSSNFEIRKVSVDSLLNLYNMNIPDFQRKFVWNDNKKRELIDSLIRNYPIGALTLYNDIENSLYLLVDGLQRYNTMDLYLQNPASILKFDDYYTIANTDNVLSSFCEKNGINEKKFKNGCLKKWYNSLNINRGETHYSFENMRTLMDYLSSFSGVFTEIDNFQFVRELLLKPIDIRQKNIALIIYDGSRDDLPDLFTKINKKNVSLTPYEILHSMWYRYTMPSVYRGKDFKQIFAESLKSESYSSRNASSIDSFNVYMYLVALSVECTPRKVGGKNSILKGNMIDRFNEGIVFDIFSTINCDESNKISTVIDKFCKNKNESDYSSALFDIGEEMCSSIKLLNGFLEENGADEIKSKYFYIYLAYIIYNTRQFMDSLPFNKKFIEDINNAGWFKDRFRQVSFFNERIRDFKELLLRHINGFRYSDENNSIEYYFKSDSSGVFVGLETKTVEN